MLECRSTNCRFTLLAQECFDQALLATELALELCASGVAGWISDGSNN